MMTIKEYNEIFYRVGVYHDSTPIWTQQPLPPGIRKEIRG